MTVLFAAAAKKLHRGQMQIPEQTSRQNFQVCHNHLIEITKEVLIAHNTFSPQNPLSVFDFLDCNQKVEVKYKVNM